MARMECKVCKLGPSVHQSGATFCWQCGAKLTESKECGCGWPVHPIDTFCPGCGKQLKGEIVHV